MNEQSTPKPTMTPEQIKLKDGRELFWQDRLHEDEVGCAVPGKMIVVDDDEVNEVFPVEEDDFHALYLTIEALQSENAALKSRLELLVKAVRL